MTARWIISAILIGLALLATSGNLWIAVQWYLFKKRASMIPFVGGLAGMIGLLLLPVSKAHRFWWAPLLLDLGCGLMLVGVAIEQIKKMIRRGRNSE